MSLAALDIALRGASVALLLLLAASLARDAKYAVGGRLAIAFALGSAAHAATCGIGPGSISAWDKPLLALSTGHVDVFWLFTRALIALSTGNAVVFWLFTRALFDDGFRPRWWHGLIWAAVMAFSFVNCLFIAPIAMTGTGTGTVFVTGEVMAVISAARVSIIAVNLLALGFIALAVIQSVRSWTADLVEQRRSLRVFIVSATALYGGANAVLQIAMSGGEPAAIANVANSAVLAGIVGAISVAMMHVQAADLFPAAIATAREVSAPLSSPPDSSAPDQKLVDALLRLMADERIYRRENLTIGMLATKLGAPEYRLRRLINQKLGYRNFNVFLNNHRIEEAKAALADPAQAEVPVITIAMDAGFQSLGPFNRAFKAMTGLTPSEYRRLKTEVA
jgi:AraC-like DNA-binding protein